MMRRVALTLLTLLIVAASSSWLVFQYLQKRIALNAHAPHLTRLAEPAAELTFRTLDGEPKRLSELKGKVVFLDLWGTWCLQCVAEMPTVQSLYGHYRNDPQVVFLIVSRLDSPATVRRYASRNHFGLPF